VSEAGPRRPSQGTSGGPEVSPSAPARGGAKGIYRRKALRAWEATALVCRLWKGSLVLLFQLTLAGGPRQRSATGSVRELIVRPVQWKKTPAHGLTPPTRKWSRPLVATRRGEDDIVCLSGCTSEASRLAHAAPIRGVTRGRKCLRAIRRQTGRRSPTPAQACWGRAGC